MIGITSLSVYLPSLRLKNETIAQAWGRPASRGQKAVANHDEDSLTMAIQASLNCPETVKKSDGLFFASTTSPYGEKSASSFMATVLDCPQGTRSADFSGSLRAGTAALLAAWDGLKAGSLNQALVAAADCRLAAPGSLSESMVGDGACALVLGKNQPAAELVASYSIHSSYADSWRKSGDLYFDIDDPRFSQIAGYSQNVTAALKGLLQQTDLKPEAIAKLVTVAPDLRSQSGVAGKLGFRPEQLQDPLATSVGGLGCAHPFLALAAALADAKAGELLLFSAYGDGADALLLKVNDGVEKLKQALKLELAVAGTREMKSYAKYLSFRSLIKGEEPKKTIFTSTSMQLREQDQTLKLYGRKCPDCGHIYHIPVRVCPSCRSKDKFERVKLARRGKIFTFTEEYYYPGPETPIPMAVVDLDSGGRMIMQMTDTEAGEAKVGLEVELVFRRLHQAGGFHNYYWKCRPLRG
ncbi:MAG: OB-fold domain-containing protein [Thermodesulfobacteriota bacterium]